MWKFGHSWLRHSLLSLSLMAWGFAPAHAADVTGFWLGHDKDGYVEIRPCGVYLCGYVVSVFSKAVPANPRDIYNEDPAKRSRPICGIQVLGELKNEGSSWGGWVYDPWRGKTFSVDVWLDNPNTLSIRGYVGLRLLSETKVWTRASSASAVVRCDKPHA